MIKFFRQSYPIQYVILVLMAVALWIPSFISGNAIVGMDSPVTPLFNIVDGLLGNSSLAQHAVAFVLLLVNALLFNAILVENQIVGKVGTMGAFVFILIMSLTCTQTNFFPFSFSLPFILLVLKELYSVYFAQKPEIDLLKVGIFIALASMCYFPSIILFFWALVALPIAKKGSLRLELIPITGFLLTYFLYFSGVFLFGDFPSLIQGYADWFSELTLSVEGFNLKSILLLAFIIIVSILLYLGSGNANFEKTVAVRTKMTISVLLAFLSIILLFFGGSIFFNGLICVALTIIIAYEFSYIGNTGWAELFLTMFLLSVFANHYYFKIL